MCSLQSPSALKGYLKLCVCADGDEGCRPPANVEEVAAPMLKNLCPLMLIIMQAAAQVRERFTTLAVPIRVNICLSDVIYFDNLCG